MIEFQMNYFLSVLLAAALVGAGWLGLCRALPPLRCRPGLRYGGAALLVWVPTLLAPGGLTIYSVAATLVVDVAVGFAAFYLTCGKAQQSGGPEQEGSVHAH